MNLKLTELEFILSSLGYFAEDPVKRTIVQSYIEQADNFMTSAGVPDIKLQAPVARSIRILWAEAMEKGEGLDINDKHKYIVNLLDQLR